MDEDLNRALAAYATRFHGTVGSSHHVASPLGAWLLLASTASVDTAGPDGDLAGVLGMDPARAAGLAAALLNAPHPLVAAASAVWHGDRVDPGRLAGWRATSPPATTFGPLPDQDGLDRWAREHTLGLVDSFPIRRSADLAIMLASALATRVSWDEPFGVVPALSWGSDSAWATRSTHALRSPERGHHAFVATSEQAGDMIVHVAPATWRSPDRSATAGLRVVSVAAAADVAPDRVLAAAYEIAPRAALGSRSPGGRSPGRRSLFDLPLGDAPLWTVREESAHDSVREHCRAVLPCWSATSDHDLSAPELGFPAVTRVLETLPGVRGADAEARQTAVARYGRYGFEAAAVTRYAMATGLPPRQPVRFAELRFGHPYAVVAVTSQSAAASDGVVDGPWNGVPVFSAWVSDPEDVPESDRTGADGRRR